MRFWRRQRRRFTPWDDDEYLAINGTGMLRRSTVVFALQQDDEFEVEDREGVVSTGLPGDYVAFDAVTGYIWIIPQQIMEHHYEPLDRIIAPLAEAPAHRRVKF